MTDDETPLRRIREELGVSQEAVARRTTASTGTYRRAENGYPVNYSTAQEILQAINSFLKERGKKEVTLDDLGLQLT
jgi:transcriptional regulator with XRE-family HTH domain